MTSGPDKITLIGNKHSKILSKTLLARGICWITRNKLNNSIFVLVMLPCLKLHFLLAALSTKVRQREQSYFLFNNEISLMGKFKTRDRQIIRLQRAGE